jgi:hypothetical protein
MFDQKKYYIKNIEKFRNYYNENKDYILEYEKIYYQENKTEIRDKQNIYFKKYYLLNKQKINNNSLQRYYNKHGLNYNTNLRNQILDQNIIIRITDD